MDLDALSKAVAVVETHGVLASQPDDSPTSILVTAARAVLAGNAWMCGTYSTVHFDEHLDEHLDDDGSCLHCRSRAAMAGCGPVSMVRVRLLAEEGT